MDIPLEKIKGVKKIGVQLPDGLKSKIPEILNLLGDFEVYISGESCFGACDIDLELLKDVDLLLHVGHTPVVDLPNIVYIPYFIDYDPKINLKIEGRKVALIGTVQYCHKLPEVKAHLESMGYDVELKRGSKRVCYPGQVLGCNYSVLKESNADTILFVGDGLFHPKGAAVYTGKTVYAYNPLTKEFQVIDQSGFLKKRYIAVARCNGKRLGIIVSTKPGQKRLGLAVKVREIARKKGYQADIVYMNDITPEKVYNLPYDFFVNTACPRICYDDDIRFEKPIITSQEFEFLVGLRDEIVLDEIE